MNSFGRKFRFTTFGESHGVALGCIVDGVPAGIQIDLEYIQSQMNMRKPGQNKSQTARKEEDKIEILSGVFEGLSTGTPIAMILYNGNQKSGDYENVKNIFRPAHADFTYFHKYGIRDYRGGGRSSARETSARVAAGAIADLILREVGIIVQSGVCEIDGIKSENYDFDYALTSPIFTLDKDKEDIQMQAILNAKDSHDSVGGVALVRALNVPIGLGEPIYYKLDSLIADAMMSINAVKGIEIGDGFDSVRIRGSENNDQITKQGFSTNHSGGILGGISNGDEITAKIYFKPTPSIFIEQNTINTDGDEVKYKLSGRHDPCVATRGSVVAKSMMSIVLADMLLLNMGSRADHLKKIYGTN
jgi:chorismate synthase